MVKAPFLIGGDFNAHHVAWGCSDNDIHGSVLLNAIEEKNITYLNTGKYTHIIHFGGENSAIDLSLTFPCLRPYLEWDIMEKLTILNQHKKWNTQKADWDTFYIECINEFSKSKKYTYTEFITTLNKVIEQSIPSFEKKKINGKSGKFWWNDRCDKVVLSRKESMYYIRITLI